MAPIVLPEVVWRAPVTMALEAAVPAISEVHVPIRLPGHEATVISHLVATTILCRTTTLVRYVPITAVSATPLPLAEAVMAEVSAVAEAEAVAVASAAHVAEAEDD